MSHYGVGINCASNNTRKKDQGWGNTWARHSFFTIFTQLKMSGYPGLASKQKRMNAPPMQTQPVTMQPQTVIYRPSNIQPMPIQPIPMQPMPVQQVNMQPIQVQPIQVHPMPMQPIKIEPVRMTPMTDTPIQVQQEIKTNYPRFIDPDLKTLRDFFGDSTHIYLYTFGVCPFEKLLDSLTALTVVAGQITAYITIIAQCLTDPARLAEIEDEGPKVLTYPGGVYLGMMILVTPFIFPDFYLSFLWIMPDCKCKCSFKNLFATSIVVFEVLLAGVAALLCAFFGETSSSGVTTILAAVGPLLIHDIDDKIYTFWVKLEGKSRAKFLAYVLFWASLLVFYFASLIFYGKSRVYDE